MSEISVRRSHGLTIEQARKAAEKIAARLKQDFELHYAWQRHVLRFERPGLHGELHVGKDEVRLEAKLGFLLAFLKPRIEDEIDRQFDRYFAAAAKPVAPSKKAARKRP